MTPPGAGEFALALGCRLQGARRIAVVGIGDELSPLDCLGMKTAREIEEMCLPGVKVVLAGLLPESMTGPLRLFRPDVVLFLDAAEMGVRPGTIAIVEPGAIMAALFSVHVLPLSVVMEFVERDLGTEVILLGIQPDTARTRAVSPGQGILRSISGSPVWRASTNLRGRARAACPRGGFGPRWVRDYFG